MKKLLLTLGIAATGLTAMAVNPMTVNRQSSVDMTAQAVSVTAVAKAGTPVLANAAAETNLTPLAEVNGNEVYVAYSTPGCIYYPSVWSADGNYYVGRSAGMVAPFVPVTYVNYTQYYDADAKKVVFLEGDAYADQFTWFYGRDNQLEQVAEDFEYTYPPSFLRGVYGYTVPTLVYDDAQYELLVNGQYTQFLYVGDSGVTQDDFNQISEVNSMVFDHVMFRPYSRYHENMLDGDVYYLGLFCMGSNDTEKLNATVSNAFSDISDFQANSLVQLLPTGNAPMALKKIQFHGAVLCNKGASFNLKIVAVNDRGQLTDKVIHEQKYTMTSTGHDTNWTYFDIDLTSDNGVEEVNYVLVDQNAAIVLTDFKGFKQFSPAMQGFSTDRTLNNPRPALTRIGGTAVNEDGEKNQYYVSLNTWIWGSDEDGYEQFGSMAINYDLEYVYIAPDLRYLSDSVEDVDKADRYSVELDAVTPEADFRMVCPGSLDDVMVSLADGSDLPDWLSVVGENFSDETLAAWQTQLDMTDPIEAASFILGFIAKDPSKVEPCTVVVDYKGVSAIFDINGGDPNSGVETNVVEAAEQSVELFDLQGRRLMAEPQNGIYVRRAILTDGTVRSTKVVR